MNDGVSQTKVEPQVILLENKEQLETADEFHSLIWPLGDALLHNTAPLLLQYARAGCLVDCGRNWTKEDIQAAVAKGLHVTALTVEAAKQLHTEALEKK